MTFEDVRAGVAEVLREHFGLQAEDPIEESQGIVSHFKADSLDQTELVMLLEDKFNIAIAVSLPDGAGFTSVGGIVRHIARLLNVEGPG